MNSRRPKTIDEMKALPEGPAIGFKTHKVTEADLSRGYATFDGRRINLIFPVSKVMIPVIEPVVASWAEDGEPISFIDDGINWTIGQYANGNWFKQRR